jgi:hypothetical protein
MYKLPKPRLRSETATTQRGSVVAATSAANGHKIQDEPDDQQDDTDDQQDVQARDEQTQDNENNAENDHRASICRGKPPHLQKFFPRINWLNPPPVLGGHAVTT